MQLLSQQYNRSITEYCPLYRGGSVGSTIIHPLIDFSRYFEDETSVFIRKLKKISRLERIYYFHNPDEVKKFLLTHEYLIEYLFEAYDQIRRIFGEDIEVHLEYDIDPEENFDGLFITIVTHLSPDQSLDLLEKFDDEWWLQVDFKIRSVITIMVKPV